MADRKSFLLRLPGAMLDELNRWAKDDLRSLNAQIEFLLRESLRRQRKAQPEGAPLSAENSPSAQSEIPSEEDNAA